MFKLKKIKQVLLITFLMYSSSLLAQEQHDTISKSTPFRKDRWITGLSGSISSGSNNLGSSLMDMKRNQYIVDFRSGKFVKDRLLVGGLVSLSRNNSQEYVLKTEEMLYAGPLATWYFSNGEQGSLFASGAGVFTKFRDESEINQSGISNHILVDGIGGGMLIRLGYAYVLHDRISFDLSVNYSHSWLYADVKDIPTNTNTKDTFSVTDLSFSFGFSVILDNFFF